MQSDNVSSADNQQETSRFCKFYYTGFCVGEMSCSLIKANHKHGVYYTPDFTVANADLCLLKEINRVIGINTGIISPIKGGYNLKFRGVRKVQLIFQFFDNFPVVAGDIAKHKLSFLRNVLPAIGKYSQVQDRFAVLEQCRKDLKFLKLHGLVQEIRDTQFETDGIGYFLAGIIDAEGSCGLKKSDKRQQPFFAVAMKDRKIIYLLKDFLGCGNIHIRSDDGLYHWEANRKSEVLKLIAIFTEKYPSKLLKMRERMQNLKRFLNDYTPRPHN
ncbi:MAG: LAGLIDADG family homing endonuclease [Candidatus Levybacteria bacterium]|nr:LAGLIDADG family homing endonuclease [Candidatus Levybacteria bacterium]